MHWIEPDSPRPGLARRSEVGLAARCGLAVLAILALPAIAHAQAAHPPAITDPASPNAADLANLYNVIFFMAVGVFVLVEGLILYATFKFRRRPEHAHTLPAQVHGNATIEMVWTVVPAIIVIVISALSYRSLVAGYAVPADAIKVNAIGHQWWWEFQYAAPIVSPTITTATELVVPVGKPVQVMLDSVDVLHAFWVPQLAGKRDAVPGTRDGGYGQNNVWFVVNRPGRFEGQCAELCGAQHSGMRFTVVAMAEADYQAWLAAHAQPAAPPPPGSAQARGLELMSKRGCQGCHSIDGVKAMLGKVGPNLTHVAERKRLAGGVFENTPANLTSWVDNPQVHKPSAVMPDLGLKPDEIADVVAYLQSLK